MPSSLSQILNNGKTALLAHQRALSSTANNAANVSTPGYNRRESHFSSKPAEEGVKLHVARRSTDQYITTQILDQSAAYGAADVKTSTLNAIDRMFRESDGNIGTAIDRFFNSVRNLTLAPADVDRRQETMSKAEELAQTMSGIAKRIEHERHGIDSSLDTMVDKVNTLSQELAKLNIDLTTTPGQEAQNGAVLDRQQLVLKELSELVPVHSFRDKQGHLTVLLGGGEPLVQKEESAQLKTVPDPTLDGLRRIDMIGISGVSINVTKSISGGRLGGTIDLRDKTMTAVISRIDQLAYDLSTKINAVHQAGFGLDGVNGRSLFAAPPPGVKGAAAAMALHADMAGDPSRLAAANTAASANGGNEQLMALQALEDQSLAGGGTRTFAHEVAAMIGVVGRTVKGNEQRIHQTQVAKEAAEGMEQAMVGISLDEEMIDLMRFQRAYQASSKIITTVDELYQTVLQLK